MSNETIWNDIKKQIMDLIPGKPLFFIMDQSSFYSSDKGITYIQVNKHTMISYKYYGARLNDELMKLLDSDEYPVSYTEDICIYCPATQESFEMYKKIN